MFQKAKKSVFLNNCFRRTKKRGFFLKIGCGVPNNVNFLNNSFWRTHERGLFALDFSKAENTSNCGFLKRVFSKGRKYQNQPTPNHQKLTILKRNFFKGTKHQKTLIFKIEFLQMSRTPEDVNVSNRIP